MDFGGDRYYKPNRILLLCLGLWPYQSSAVLKKLQVAFFQMLFLFFLVCQLNTFFVKQGNIDLVMKVSMYVVMDIIFIVKYNAWLLLADRIKYIFEIIRYDWKTLKIQAEMEIIRRYASNARTYTIQFISLVTVSISLLFVLFCAPSVLNVIVPINESRPREMLIVADYFLNDKTHFYVILTFIGITLYVGCTTMTAVATLVILYILHICALFKIASYRIEHIFDENVLQLPKHIGQCVLYKKVVDAVHAHRRATDLATIMTNSFATYYLVLLGLGVASTSISCVNLFNAVDLENEIEILLYFGIISMHLYYIFLGNYVCQDVINSSSDIFQTIYCTRWYASPVWIQKLILIMLQRSRVRSSLTAGGLFDASLEGFATLMSMSLSYITVLRSTRNQQETIQEL